MGRRWELFHSPSSKVKKGVSGFKLQVSAKPDLSETFDEKVAMELAFAET